MESRGLMFLDFNGTFDDVSEIRSTVFIDALKEYIDFYNGNVDICVITSALHSDNPDISVTGDLITSLYKLPKPVREKFTFLIENQCQYVSAIDHREGMHFRLLNPTPMRKGEKKDGVERLVKMIGKSNEISTCIFAGDMITDAGMLCANIGERNKIFIYAKKGMLKEFDPTVPRYKLSLNPNKFNFDFGRDIDEKVGPTKKIFVRTSTNCFGVGKGLHAAVSYLKYQQAKSQHQTSVTNPHTTAKPKEK